LKNSDRKFNIFIGLVLLSFWYDFQIVETKEPAVCFETLSDLFLEIMFFLVLCCDFTVWGLLTDSERSVATNMSNVGFQTWLVQFRS